MSRASRPCRTDPPGRADPRAERDLERDDQPSLRRSRAAAIASWYTARVPHRSCIAVRAVRRAVFAAWNWPCQVRWFCVAGFWLQRVRRFGRRSKGVRRRHLFSRDHRDHSFWISRLQDCGVHGPPRPPGRPDAGSVMRPERRRWRRALRAGAATRTGISGPTDAEGGKRNRGGAWRESSGAGLLRKHILYNFIIHPVSSPPAPPSPADARQPMEAGVDARRGPNVFRRGRDSALARTVDVDPHRACRGAARAGAGLALPPRRIPRPERTGAHLTAARFSSTSAMRRAARAAPSVSTGL